MCVNVPPGRRPGCKSSVVPVYEISIVVPFVIFSTRRRKDTSKSGIDRGVRVLYSIFTSEVLTTQANIHFILSDTLNLYTFS